VPLFLRNARGLEPTAQGEIAIRGAAMLLAELSHLGSETAQQPAITLLRIGTPPFVAQGYLPGVLAGLAAQQPHVRVQLKEERVPLLVQCLLDGQLDALITSYPTELPEAAGQPLRYEKLFDTGFTVIAPKDHPAGHARSSRWEDLARQKWILPTRSSMLRRMMEEVFRREGVIAPTPVIESTSPFTNLQLVRAGLGLSAVPDSTLQASPRSLGVRRVRVTPAISKGPVALIYRSAVANPRVALLRATLGLSGPAVGAP
jgi:DNA-binding transcriptional LysR family regulator